MQCRSGAGRSRHRQLLADYVLVRHGDGDMLLDHLPLAVFFPEDDRAAKWDLRAIRQPEGWTIGDPPDVALAIGQRIAADDTDGAHFLHLSFEDPADGLAAGPPLVRVAADEQ